MNLFEMKRLTKAQDVHFNSIIFLYALYINSFQYVALAMTFVALKKPVKMINA